MRSINPATGEQNGEYAEHAATEVDQRLAAAAAAQHSWRDFTFRRRTDLLQKVALTFRRDKEKLAELAAREMGKPIEQGRAEVEKCAAACEYFARHAEAALAPEHLSSEFTRSYILFQPLGVLLAVMPWNFPYWQVVRAAAPALMAGNAFVLKHASNVCGCALALERVFAESGAPEGLFNSLLVSSSRVEKLIAHPSIAAVTLTGSTAAGQSVARTAGAHIKKTVLELGGSDPYLVLEDADLEHAAKVCATSRLINSGQSCIAAKRFIVVEAVAAQFTERLLAHLQSKVVGDPLDARTEVGPLARHELRDSLDEQVQRTVKQGATLLLGGQIPSDAGAYYPVTMLTGVRPGMAAFDEETFGPVASITTARNETEAIQLANQTVFGLGGAVFTSDLARGERVAARLECGAAFVNDFVRSDPRLPFGGVKQSGYGRELGILGIREFVNVKTVCVR